MLFMIITVEQILNNLLLVAFIALIIEIAVMGLLSIRYLEGILSGDKIRNLLIAVVAFGLCSKIPQLRILYKAQIKIPDLIHLIITGFILVRVTDLIHDWFVNRGI